jgi:uncharacterized protein (DUF2147 family)
MENYLSLMAFCVAILCSPPSIAEFEKGDEILGVWLNAQQDGFIRIYKNENNFEGAIVGSPNPEDTNRVDINNPNPQLRNQLLKGLVILNGVNFAGNNQWTKGQVYDPNNGKTYQCVLELTDHKNLSVRGYIGIPLFGRTEVWTRKQ